VKNLYENRLTDLGAITAIDASFNILIEYLFGTSALSQAIVFYGMNYAMLVASAISRAFGYHGVASIEKWAMSGYYSPSKDHKVYCTDCGDFIDPCDGSSISVGIPSNNLSAALISVKNLVPTRYTYLQISGIVYGHVLQGASIEFFNKYDEMRCFTIIGITGSRSSGSVDLPMSVYIDDVLIQTFTSNSFVTTGNITSNFTLTTPTKGRILRLDFSVGLGNNNYESWYTTQFQIHFKQGHLV